jgi:hypothetical protein
MTPTKPRTDKTLTFVTALRIALCGGLVVATVVAVPHRAEAADQKAALAKIKAHYQSAAAAYDDGDLAKAQALLQQALKVADENGVGSQKLVAQVYLLYGVLQVAGLKETDKGVKSFAKALDISPAIQVPPTMSSKAVLAAFDRAENQESEAAAPPSPAAPDETEEALLKSPQAAKPARAAKSEPPARRDPPRSDPPRADPDKEELVDELAAAKVSESLQQAEKDRLQKEKQEQDKELASSKGHAQQLAQQLTKEKQDADKQLAASQAGEKKERETSNKLAHDKSESDKQLAEAKRSLLELTKLKADTDRQLAAARDEAKKEREAKEKLAQQKAETDKQLAEEKRNLLEMTKQKADTDRQLVAVRDEAKKEHEAKEKLAAARREADARDAERKAKELQERTAREKLAEGPELPPHVFEPISCTIPDEVAPGTDLFVHCVPRRGIDAKVVALYYRAGGVVYNVSTMDRSKKGWYTALIPGGKIAGKVLHYYVEARDSRQDVVGANGHANSPNIATIRPGKSR